MNNHAKQLAGTICAAACLAAPIALPCPIPVFQYALDHWKSDPYEIVARDFDSWTGEQRAEFERIECAGSEGKANIVTRRETHEAESGQSEPPAVKSEKTEPRMELHYPPRAGLRRPIWTGEPSEKNIALLLDSPARAKASEMLLKDKSAVWVLLECGDKAKDNAAFDLLEKELRRLEKTLVVPDPGEWGLSDTDLRPVAFGALRVRRDDPKEAIFIRMLIESEDDLPGIKDQPMLFPIYGRGLLLYGMVGDGINTWTITATAEFVTGPCSCQVKAGNPGLDLLMAVDWESSVKKLSRPSVQTPVGAAGFLDRMEEAEKKLDALE